MTKNKAKPLAAKDYEELGRMIEQVISTGYTEPKRLFWISLLKGIGYGFGIFIGGTIVVGILLAMLNRFNEIPVLSPFIQKIVEIVNSANQIPGL